MSEDETTRARAKMAIAIASSGGEGGLDWQIRLAGRRAGAAAAACRGG
jgi:hypothetical protein